LLFPLVIGRDVTISKEEGGTKRTCRSEEQLDDTYEGYADQRIEQANQVKRIPPWWEGQVSPEWKMKWGLKGGVLSEIVWHRCDRTRDFDEGARYKRRPSDRMAGKILEFEEPRKSMTTS
jgi:hypothetical protein